MLQAVIDQDITPTERLVDRLPNDWEISVGIGSSETETKAALDGRTIAFVTSRIPMTAEIIKSASDLDVIAKLGTGLDSVAVDVAREYGIEVTYTPGMNALSVAEHTLTLALSTARHLTEARRLIENGQWRDDMTLATRLSGTTVGIIGFGNIGRRVASLFDGFNVNIVVYDPYISEIETETTGATLVSLEELLERSDIVSVNAECTEETTGMLGATEFATMKPSAILVNTARGPLVSETALVEALQNEEIAGVGLDVHHTEPIHPNSPLLEMDNVVLTPHIASMTNQSRKETIDKLSTNTVALHAGETIPDRFLAPSDSTIATIN